MVTFPYRRFPTVLKRLHEKKRKAAAASSGLEHIARLCPGGSVVAVEEPTTMDVVCIIGDRVYHAPGSPCHRALDGRGTVLTLTEAQAHEVGMEPCGYCITTSSEQPTADTR